MNAEEWFNECLFIDGGVRVRRKDALNLSIPREQFIRDNFISIQSSAEVTIPAPRPGEDIDKYHARVIKSARQAGIRVITEAK